MPRIDAVEQAYAVLRREVDATVEDMLLRTPAPDAVYPPAAEMAVANNLGFLEEFIRYIPVLNFVSRTSGILYLRYEDGKGQLVDGPTLA